MLIIGLAIADPIFLHLNVDDFESSPTTIVLQVVPSNTNLFGSISTSNSLDGTSRVITLQNKTYGSSQLNIYAYDNGLDSISTGIITVIDGNSTMGTDLSHPYGFQGYSYGKNIYLNWSNVANAYGYKVMRAEVNSSDAFKTIGITGATSFIDTNVVLGTQYWYLVNWVPPNLTNIYANNIRHSVISVNIQYVSPIHIYYFPDGFGFISPSNSTYQVLYKTNITNAQWSVLSELPLASGTTVFYHDSNGFFRNKIFYVKEK